MDNTMPDRSSCTLPFNPADSGYEEWTSEFAKSRQACPVFWSQGHGGYWASGSYAEVTEAARDWESFSSRKVWDPDTGFFEGGNVVPSFPGPAFIPVEADPPEWKRYRFFLNPFFSPKSVEAYRPMAQRMADALLDRVIEKGEMDLITDYSNALPALCTLQILGIPFEANDWERWATPFHQLAYARELPIFEQTLKDLDWIRSQIGELAEACWKQPREGIFSAICNADLKDGRFSKQELIDLGMMLLVGGVGTTNALFANTMVYLDQNAQARQQLRDNPEWMPRAREEFVRYFSPVHGQARLVTHDVELGGQQLHKGEQILLAFSAANRDEKVFPDAGQVVLDRMPNPHVGFGSGMHRCLGSFLARVFFDSMFEAAMRRIPDYTIDHDAARRYPCVASVNGWITVPTRFTPAVKVGGLSLS
jgi:cytochrome P450